MTQEDTQKPQNPLRMDSMTQPQAAKIFSHVYGQIITEQQVRDIADAGELLRPDDTFNLIHYCAYIVKEMGRGKS